VDHWNQVHVFFGDNNYQGTDLGLCERVWREWQWTDWYRIDSIDGDAEAVASGDRLHLLIKEGYLVNPDIEYAFRDMDPPGIAEAEPTQVKLRSLVPNPVTPLTEISFAADRSGPEEIDIFNSAGRRVWSLETETLSPGPYSFFPYSHLPGPGVFYCRLRTGANTKVVKLVRIN
jgi:hypothetical protein